MGEPGVGSGAPTVDTAPRPAAVEAPTAPIDAAQAEVGTTTATQIMDVSTGDVRVGLDTLAQAANEGAETTSAADDAGQPGLAEGQIANGDPDATAAAELGMNTSPAGESTVKLTPDPSDPYADTDPNITVHYGGTKAGELPPHDLAEQPTQILTQPDATAAIPQPADQQIDAADQPAPVAETQAPPDANLDQAPQNEDPAQRATELPPTDQGETGDQDPQAEAQKTPEQQAKEMQISRDELVAKLVKSNPDIDLKNPDIQAFLDNAGESPEKMQSAQALLEQIAGPQTKDAAEALGMTPKEFTRTTATSIAETLEKQLAKIKDKVQTAKEKKTTEKKNFALRLLRLLIKGLGMAVAGSAIAVAGVALKASVSAGANN